MIALAMLFGYAMFMMGSDFAAIQGGWARRLDLPGSALAPYMPLVALAVYVLSVTVIIRFKVRWRWTSFIAATVLGNVMIMYPAKLLEAAKRIPLGDSLSRESRQAFEAKYPVKWVSDGRSLYVRHDDYSPELAAFVTDLAEHQAKPRTDTSDH